MNYLIFQMQESVYNHLTKDKTYETRHVAEESARITRGVRPEFIVSVRKKQKRSVIFKSKKFFRLSIVSICFHAKF